jgi:hypothetical protein
MVGRGNLCVSSDTDKAAGNIFARAARVGTLGIEGLAMLVGVSASGFGLRFMDCRSQRCVGIIPARL